MIETDSEYLNRKKIIDEYMKTYIPNSTNLTEIELENVYEHIFGADSIDKHTHEELITMIDEMYDCYKYVVDNIYSKGKHIK
jgi:hypothetical protein